MFMPGRVAGAYPLPTILDESASVELVIDGQVVGRSPWRTCCHGGREGTA